MNKKDEFNLERIRADHKARRATFGSLRADAGGDDDGDWRTLENGVHIHINGEGEVDKGPSAVRDKMNQSNQQKQHDHKVDDWAERIISGDASSWHKQALKNAFSDDYDLRQQVAVRCTEIAAEEVISGQPFFGDLGTKIGFERYNEALGNSLSLLLPYHEYDFGNGLSCFYAGEDVFYVTNENTKSRQYQCEKEGMARALYDNIVRYKEKAFNQQVTSKDTGDWYPDTSLFSWIDPLKEKYGSQDKDDDW